MPKKYEVRFGPKIHRRFPDYNTAFAFLTNLRAEAGKKDADGRTKFDSRDYQIKLKPLAFSILADEWLSIKEKQVRAGTMTSYRQGIRWAVKAWGRRNIKDIGFADVQRLLLDLPLADKTKFNALNTLKQFWQWACDAHDIPAMKKWPKQSYDMAYRNTIDIETQEAILDIIRVQQTERPRVWFGVKLLATYPSVRPGELIRLQEKHFDREKEIMIVPPPAAKDHRLKIIPLIDEDIEFLLGLTRGLPDLPFFRDDRNGKKLGSRTFYSAWKRACKELGIEDVDLYGGTKHSSVMALRQVATFEEIRQATMHQTNKAFERYYRTEGEELKSLYGRRKQLGNKKADVVTINSRYQSVTEGEKR